MVFVRPDLKKRDLVATADLFADFLQMLVNCGTEDRTAVLRRTHDVVEQYRYIMAFVNEFAHSHILAQQAAGNYPQRFKRKAL